MLHPIDLPHTSRLYKTLLQGGHFLHTTHPVSHSPSFPPSVFASPFIATVREQTTVAMAIGDGAFVVAELLQRVSEEGSEDEKQTLKGWFTADVRSDLKGTEGKGRNVLLGKIAGLA
ncbi:hypothetical protein PILCRDRAFT_766179 [Piloderma croceum F 1598]|uniref:Uncharacterized protein n=1 Tax=Piloderma croceum (strain F 1598) TaxID=765440 RepID=A0A0C3GFA7_PILCF|nr:hypothetical protein PILCRDRAFT_766179 [Piloderma croceum F 1598]